MHFSVGRLVFLGLALAATAVYGQTPNSTNLFRTVDCDPTTLDYWLEHAVDMAKQAIAELYWLASDDTRFTLDDGSKDYHSFRNAELMWGVRAEDEKWISDPDNPGNILLEARVRSQDRTTLNTVRSRFEDLVQSLTVETNNYWRTRNPWIFCHPETPVDREDRPLVRAVLTGDYRNDIDSVPIQLFPAEAGTKKEWYYYPGSPYGDDGTGVGTRTAVLRLEDPNPCAPINFGGRATIAAWVQRFRWNPITETMYLCELYYRDLDYTPESIAEGDQNIDNYESRSSTLLHEMMHFRFDAIKDEPVYWDQPDGPRAYGLESCTYISGGATDGTGNSDRALRNADSYTLYAMMSWLPHNRWTTTNVP